MSDVPRYIICTELYEYLVRLYNEYLCLKDESSWYNSEWREFVEQQNLGVAVPSDSTLKYIAGVYRIVDPKQFLLTSIRLGLQYEDVPTTPLQAQ